MLRCSPNEPQGSFQAYCFRDACACFMLGFLRNSALGVKLAEGSGLMQEQNWLAIIGLYWRYIFTTHLLRLLMNNLYMGPRTSWT